jgi:phosphoglycolate phosphatase
MPSSRSLIVFDLDGTLIDSRVDLAETINEMLAGFGAAALSVDAVTAMVGEGARVLVTRALTAARCDRSVDEGLDRFRVIYDRRLLNHTRPYDGVVDVLRRAASRASVAVLTNKPEAPTRRILDAFDLTRDLGGGIIGGDSGFERKPDPAGLRHLIAAAGSGPASTMLVGDSNVDRETAAAAETAFCAALYGFGRVSSVGVTAATAVDVGGIVDAFIDRAETARGARANA